jgi:hypothetical protein
MRRAMRRPSSIIPFHDDRPMTNPWLKKNPYMSIWLSGLNSAAHSARGFAAAEMQRQTAAAFAEGMTQAMRFWTAVLSPPKPRTRRRARRR